MRTFTFSDAKSHKFWNIDVQGTKFVVTYGKINTAGQSSEKSFVTEEKCQSEADKLIREKTGKGYIETTPEASTSDDTAFEKSLIAQSHDLAAWSAYADYLTEKGDERGEFMSVQIALEDESLSKAERAALTKREKEFLKKHEREWLGDLVPYTLDYVKPEQSYSSMDVHYTFRRGWIQELRVSRIGVNLARAIVKNPNLRFLQSLQIESMAYEYEEGPDVPSYADGTYKPGPDTQDAPNSDIVAWHLLVKFPHFASVRKLHLGNSYSSTETYIDSDQCHMDGTYAYHYLKQMPHVEEITLMAHRVDTNKIFALPMPNLRFLQVDHGLRYPLDKLAANKTITKLTHLICWPHALEDDEDGDDDGEAGVKAYLRLKHLKAICNAKWPDFEFLRLRCTDFGDKGAEEIVASGVLKRLKHLDLELGCMTEAGAKALAASPDLKHLEFLSLSQNAIPNEGQNLLKKAFPKVKLEAQHNEVPPFTDYVEYLYHGDME
jgi:uncharacterized protein (TIGR02996 family)